MLINQAQTAIETFHAPDFNQQVAQPQQQLILDAMSGFCVSMDWTIGELAFLTKLDKSAVSGRRHSMLAAKLIERRDSRKCTKSNKECETVGLKADLLRMG